MDQSQSRSTSLTRRRFLQYTGGVALSGSLLAACAGTGTSTPPAGSADIPTLEQWYHAYGEKGTETAVQKYAKNYTKAKVNVTWVQGVGNAYSNKVNAALIGSGAPDVFEQSGLSVDQVKAGLLADLTDVIGSAKSDFLPASLAPLTVDGKIYGIKMINDPTFIYYRKSMFKAAGITTVPGTIDELIDAAKKTAKGKVKSIYLGPDGGVDALHQLAIWAAGGDLTTDDKKIGFNTADVAAYYVKINELNKTGNVLPEAADFWWNSSPFKNGDVAMQWCGLWAMPEITAALGDDFGIFPLPPLNASGKPATVNGGWAQMVYAKGKNVDAAKAYVKSLWIEQADVQKDWNVGYGFHVPPRISTSAATDKLKTGPAADAVDILNKYGHAPTPYWNSAMDTILMDTMSSIVKNGGNAASAKSQLDAAATKCTAELQKLL